MPPVIAGFHCHAIKKKKKRKKSKPFNRYCPESGQWNEINKILAKIQASTIFHKRDIRALYGDAMLLPIRISTKMATCNRNSLLASSHLWQAKRATRKRESPSPCCSRLTFRYFPKCGACSRASYESKNLILEQLIDIEVILFSNTQTIRKATSPQITHFFYATWQIYWPQCKCRALKSLEICSELIALSTYTFWQL